MSDTRDGEGAGFVPQPAANDGVTAGTLLRRAREAAGLHVAALAVALKVPVRKLEALEDDRWDLLPDAVFVRALAASVCRSLKVDPQPILERLPQTAAPRLVRDNDGINTPFRAPSDGAPPSWLDHVTRPVFMVVFALLLGALVLVLLPSIQTEGNAGSVASNEPVANGAATRHPASAEPQAVPGEPTAAAAPTHTAPPGTPPTAITVSSTLAAPPAAAPGASPAAAEPAASASGVVVFRTKGPSWVEVTDAKGVVALRKLLESGESAGASGALPLQVTVGRVDYTEVQVRGKPYDLKPVSRDNVARFEVK